jgi:hypothetical protein
MFAEDQGPAETAISFTDQFVDAGLAKLDALFGAGYAKANPQALGAYVAACASNLNAFMTAATAALDDQAFDEAFASFEEDLRPEPAPKGRRR